MASKEAKAKIGLDYSGFQRGGDAILKIVNNINSNIKTIAAVTGGAFLFGKAIEGANAFKNSIVSNIEASLKLGESLANMGRGAGMAAGQLYTLQFAMEKGISNERAARLLGSEARILSQNAGIFRDASIKLSVIGERVKGFWLGVTEQAAPLLDRAFDKIIGFDFAAWGKKISEPFFNAGKILFQIIADGELWKTLSEMLQTSFSVIGDAFTYGFAVADSLLDSFGKKLMNVTKDALVESTRLTLGIGAAMKVRETVGDDVDSTPVIPKADFSKSTSAIDALTKLFTSKLAAFNSKSGDNREDPYENRKAYKNFGVDSLQAIGGGGGVGGGMSITDYASRQLDTQKMMLKALENLRSDSKIKDPTRPTAKQRVPITIFSM